MLKTISVRLCACLCILLAGCVPSTDDRPPHAQSPEITVVREQVTSVDKTVAYKQLPEIEVNIESPLVASPSHPKAYLSSNPIPAGGRVRVIGTDENAAWLLVLQGNTLGWIPSFYSGTGIGTLKLTVVDATLSDKCTRYLGALTAPEEAWASRTSGPVVTQGIIYRPQPGEQLEDSILSIEIDGAGQVVAPEKAQTPMPASSEVFPFTFAIKDLKQDSRIRFQLTGFNDEPLAFQAAFFSNECPGDLDAAGSRGGPPPTQSLPDSKTTPIPAPTSGKVIVVTSGLSKSTATSFTRDRSSPEQAIIDYWNTVSNGWYEIAWDGLSPDLKQRKHANSYTDYVQGYQAMKLCSVNADNVRLVQQSNHQAVVYAHLVYRTGSSCTVSEYDFDFHMVSDRVDNIWLIDNVVPRSISSPRADVTAPNSSPHSTPTPTLIASNRGELSQEQNGWTYQYEQGRNSGNLTTLINRQLYNNVDCYISPQEDYVRLCHNGELHPGQKSRVAYRWDSYHNGPVTIKVHAHKIDTSCGDGVWVGTYIGEQEQSPQGLGTFEIGGSDNRGKTEEYLTNLSSNSYVLVMVDIRRTPECDQSRVYIDISRR